MQLILLEKVHNLGNLGDKVKVKAGHGRNYLIPQGKAVSATADNIAKFEAKRAELEKAAAAALAASQKRAEVLANQVVELKVKAGDEGRLFGSVGTRDIAEALIAKGAQVEKNEILMPDGVIRQVGEYELFILLHGDIRVAFKVIVTAE